MNIVHDAQKHKFTAYAEDGRRMGEIAYAPEGQDLLATHTVVDKEFRGGGVAQGLLDALAAYAGSVNKRIVPICSFVAASFERFPDRYQSVIRDADRR